MTSSLLKVLIRFIHKVSIISILLIHSKYFYYCYRNSKIVIFDIDNTICETWPSLLNPNINNKERWRSLVPYDRISKLILTYHLEGFEVIYLTARPWSSYFVTKKWLKEYNLPFKNVVITLKAEYKIYFLKVLKQEYSYFDDLSYNTEKGQVKFYMDVINFVKEKSNITYYGYDYLLRLEKGEI